MIIHHPEITQDVREICLSARIEFEHAVADIPDTLWFYYPRAYADQITDRADAFAAGLLLLAMHLGENMQVMGKVSPKLLYGLQEYQQAFLSWFPNRFHPIKIDVEQLQPNRPGKIIDSVGLAFSGGGDSFYSLWEHLPQNQPLVEFQVTHCLFLHGFDISLAKEDDYNLACKNFEAVLGPLGISMISCRTNLHSITEGQVKWYDVHGSFLMASALGLGGLFRKFIVASSIPYYDLSPFGTSPYIDHLLSTETMQIIHHGAGLAKPYKYVAIANWPAVQQNLRVCTHQEKRLGVKNCSHCYKCLRARIILKMIGRLDAFHGFESHLSFKDMVRWVLIQLDDVQLVEEMIRYALERKKYRFLPLLWIGAFVAWVKTGLRSLIPGWLLNILKSWFYPPAKNLFLHSTISAMQEGKDT